MLTVAIATLILGAAAFYNGWPLLYPDSIEYLETGRAVYGALVHGEVHSWYGQRSPLYGLLLTVLHQDRWLWGIVLAQALAVAYLLRLVVGTIIGRGHRLRFLAIVVALTLCTSVSWFVSFVVPDVFAAVLILGVFLLTFAAASLRPRERVTVAALVILAIVVHASHLPLAVALAASAWVMDRLGRRRWGAPPAAWGLLVASVAGAVGLQMMTHLALYGRPTVIGPHPPVVLARVLADGPGRRYLEDTCPSHPFAICQFIDDLPMDFSRFLWAEDGVMRRAGPTLGNRIRDEEMAVVVGTVTSQPVEQLAASLRNLMRQVLRFGLDELRRHAYVDAHVDAAFPAGGAHYFATRQYRGTLNRTIASIVQHAVVGVSLLICVIVGWRRRRQLPPALYPLAALVVLGVLANAAVTGVLSVPVGRYGARVIWLVPLVACLVVVARRERSQPSTTSGSTDCAFQAGRRRAKSLPVEVPPSCLDHRAAPPWHWD